VVSNKGFPIHGTNYDTFSLGERKRVRGFGISKIEIYLGFGACVKRKI
jgi:hypothetical protein